MNFTLLKTSLISGENYLIQIEADSFYICKYDLTSHTFSMRGAVFEEWMAVYEITY